MGLISDHNRASLPHAKPPVRCTLRELSGNSAPRPPDHREDVLFRYIVDKYNPIFYCIRWQQQFAALQRPPRYRHGKRLHFSHLPVRGINTLLYSGKYVNCQVSRFCTSCPWLRMSCPSNTTMPSDPIIICPTPPGSVASYSSGIDRAGPGHT